MITLITPLSLITLFCCRFYSDQVMEGDIEITDSNTLLQYTIYYASGSTISSFPANNSYLYFADLKDQSNYIISSW